MAWHARQIKKSRSFFTNMKLRQRDQFDAVVKLGKGNLSDGYEILIYQALQYLEEKKQYGKTKSRFHPYVKKFIKRASHFRKLAKEYNLL